MSDDKLELASPKDMEIFSFVKYLFGEYVEEHNLDTKQMECVGRYTFWKWVQLNRQRYFTYDDQPSRDLIDMLRLSPDGCDAISAALTNDFFAAQTLTMLWPMLVLACRPPLQHEVEFIFANISIAYRDNRIAQFPMYLRQKETVQPFTDAIMCTWLWQKFRQGFNEMMQRGTDGLYEHSIPVENLPTTEAQINKAMEGVQPRPPAPPRPPFPREVA